MMTVSAVIKLMPRPPARVDKRKQKSLLVVSIEMVDSQSTRTSGNSAIEALKLGNRGAVGNHREYQAS